MPLPFTPTVWNKKSNRFCGYRSAQLKQLDQAVLSHHQDSNAFDKGSLKAVFYNWYDNNPKERGNNRRNAQQVIDQLKGYVDAAPPKPPRNAGPPPGPPPGAPDHADPQGGYDMAELMRKLPRKVLAQPELAAPGNGKTEYSAALGKDYRFLIQDLNMACGPTCVASAAGLVKGTWVHASACTAKVNAAMDKFDAKQPPLVMGVQGPSDLGQRHFERVTQTGTKMGGLADALTSFIQADGFSAEMKDITSEDELVTLVSNGPVILHISWWNGSSGNYDGGGHFVLLADANAATRVILDPWYGLQEVASGELPHYHPVGSANSRSPGAHGHALVSAAVVAINPI